MIKTGQIFIVSAPSGSGKTTLVKNLLAKDEDLEFSVSYTTRPPRGKEKSGTEYVFVSEKIFQSMIIEDKFLEYAKVFDHYYGTFNQYVEKKIAEGKDLVLDIDTNGAEQVKSRLPDAVSIFVMPPSYIALKKRLEKRQLDSAETIRKRLEWASYKEIYQFCNYDYVVINDNLTQSVDQMHCIVRAERSRQKNLRHQIKLIIDSFGGHSIGK
jgi:guanylate kinase